MKDSLHFILLGALGFLGIVMMAIGVISKTGAEGTLSSAAGQVDGALKSNPPTKGTVEFMQKAQEKFNNDIGGFEKAYSLVEGIKLMQFDKKYDTADDFNTGEASKTIADLQRRFARLKTPAPLPGRLAGDPAVPNSGATFIEEDETQQFWDNTRSEMSNRSMQPGDIEKMQARLRVMSEVCWVCEKLKTGADFKDTPFAFRKFEFGSFNQEAQPESKDPWVRHEWSLLFDADPSFALALMDALLNPTEATAGTGDNKRVGLPFELLSLAGMQMDRPHSAQYSIKLDERKKWNIPSDWKEEEEAGRFDEGKDSSKRNEVSQDLEKNELFPLPLRFELKMQALRAHKDWRVTYTPPEAPAEGAGGG